MDWFFDGIGTELISTLIGILIGAGAGGTIGYKVGISKNILIQKQKAGNDSKQKQTGKILREVDDESTENNVKTSRAKVNQKQKGGSSSVQSQIGGINSDR